MATADSHETNTPENPQTQCADLEGATPEILARVDEPTRACLLEQAQRVRDLRALVDAGIAIATERSLDSLLQRIVDVARGVVHARYAALGVLAEGSNRLERFVTAGMDEETRRKIGHLPEGRGILGVLVRENKPLRLADLTQDPRSVGFPPGHPPMRSFLGVPITLRGHVYGRLYLTEKQGAAEFSAEDENLAMSLAAQAAVAIENARLFAEVEEQQAQLMRSERLNAVGSLASTVGHELRNPLSIINNAAFYLNMKVPRDDPKVARNLDIIVREVHNATRIIEDLLDFSRVRPPQPSPLSLRALVQMALERQPVPEKVTVENRVPDELPKVWVDPNQMQQVLTNLISNAFEAMPAGGTLCLDASVVEGRAQLRVADTGEGIAPENLSQIFEPLFTTKTRGVGLGLALVRRVLEAHQGSITVQSEVGKGTTMIVALPLAPEAG